MTLIHGSQFAYEVGVFSISLPKLDETHRKTGLWLLTTSKWTAPVQFVCASVLLEEKISK